MNTENKVVNLESSNDSIDDEIIDITAEITSEELMPPEPANAQTVSQEQEFMEALGKAADKTAPDSTDNNDNNISAPEHTPVHTNESKNESSLESTIDSASEFEANLAENATDKVEDMANPEQNKNEITGSDTPENIENSGIDENADLEAFQAEIAEDLTSQTQEQEEQSLSAEAGTADLEAVEETTTADSETADAATSQDASSQVSSDDTNATDEATQESKKSRFDGIREKSAAARQGIGAVTAAASASIVGLIPAIEFFTRLPIPPRFRAKQEAEGEAVKTPSLSDSLLCFPIVGLMVGAIAAIAWSLALGFVPATIAAGFAVLVGMLITSGLHEDGLSDVADGLGGSRDKDKALEIMRDSRVGTYGAAAMVFSIGLRWVALASLSPLAGVAALLISHSTGRATIALAMRTTTYAREEGLGKAVSEKPGTLLFGLTIAASLVIAFVFGLFAGLVASLIAFAAAYSAMLYMKKRIGGYTGDTLGSMEQVGEIMVLCVLVAMWA